MADEKEKSPSSPSDDDPGDKKATESSAPVPYSVFSTKWRIYITYLLGVVMILSTITATIYFPLIPALSDQFRVGIQEINLTVTAYAIAQAVAPGIFASIADMSGRRPVLLCLVALYAASSLGLTLNRSNYPALIVLRSVQSIGGSPIPSIAYGIVADVAPVSERGAMLGPMLSTCNGISALGPVIGGAVALGTGRVEWVFLALLVLAAVCFVVVGFTLPETGRCMVGNGSKPASGIWRTWWSILKPKKRDKNKWSVSGEEVVTNTEEGNERPRWKPWSALASLRIILYKDAAAVLWMVASSYTVYYTFQVAIPVIFDEIYEYNELEIGLVFLPGLAGMTIGGIIAGKLVDRNYAIVAKQHGIEPGNDGGRGLDGFPIEAARYRKCLIFLFVEIALVVGYGWAVYFHVHPAVPITLQFFICGCSTLLSHTASALLVDIFPDQSSTAYASGQIMRCGVSAGSAAILQPLISAIGRGWFFTTFALFVGGTGAISVFVSRSKGMDWRQKRLGG